MKASITITNNNARLLELSHDVRTKGGQLVQSTAEAIATDAKLRIMNGPKTGRVYLVGKNRAHQASAPGEAPATDTGHLAASIQTAQVSDLTSEVSVGAEYAEALEYGTSCMAARPFLTPAVEKARGPFIKGIAGLFK
jgi:HK97 gp10 family phage protein